MRSDIFKKASIQLYSNNFSLKQVSTTVKKFHDWVTGDLNFKCMHCYAFLSDEYIFIAIYNGSRFTLWTPGF